MFILNKNIVHLIDDIFWNMGFKTETQAEKVIICINFIMLIMLIISIILQVRIDIGLADHVWQEKRAAIAQTVEALGDQFLLTSRVTLMRAEAR